MGSRAQHSWRHDPDLLARAGGGSGAGGGAPRVCEPPRLRHHPARRRDRRAAGRAGAELARRTDGRARSAGAAAGDLRNAGRAGDAGEGDHQRSAGADAPVQRRRGRRLRQWRARRREKTARPRIIPMSDEHFRESDLIRQRRENFQALSQLGLDPYPRQFERTHTVDELVEAHGAKTGEALEAEQPRARTAGRILAIRSFGKANFLVISDGQAKIQVYIRKDALSERDFSLYKLLDFGDFVGVEGRVFRTKTNELTIWASALEFLAKCFLPLPEKWHGLTDVETRYRQRYLDLIVNPDSRKVFAVRSRVLAAIRTFLVGRDYLEVETPMMQPIAGGALARPFATHHNALDMQLFLRIAPELYLKRLTVGGLERVFEINRNFRNEGISTQHNPEFTMLE